MKKCRHEHVVRLYEVIDAPDSKSIFLSPFTCFSFSPRFFNYFTVLEYMEGGEVAWRTTNGQPTLSVEQSRRIFRDVVLGLEYRQLALLPIHILNLNPSQSTTKVSYIETSSPPTCYGLRIDNVSRSRISAYPTFLTHFGPHPRAAIRPNSTLLSLIQMTMVSFVPLAAPPSMRQRCAY